MKDLLSQRVRAVPPSGLRRYFDIIATMDGVISLGIGEPDFVTPERIRQAGIRSLDEGFTGYTSNSGLIELRQALAEHLKRRYGAETLEEAFFAATGREFEAETDEDDDREVFA